PPTIIAFAARKDASARKVAERFKAELPPSVWFFFVAAKNGDWPAVARAGNELRNVPLPSDVPRPDPAVIALIWSWVMEVYLAFAQFALGEPKYALMFGEDIIRSIPPGSIYFGGTDAGRGLVT